MAEITDILLKLFDTLREQMRDMQRLSQALLDNQNSIGNYIRSLPMEETRDLLQSHSKNSTDEIGTCTETVEAQTDTILEEVKDLKGKVKTMIIVVVVAFTLFTFAIMIARLTDDEGGTSHQQLIEKIEELEKKLN